MIMKRNLEVEEIRGTINALVDTGRAMATSPKNLVTKRTMAARKRKAIATEISERTRKKSLTNENQNHKRKGKYNYRNKKKGKKKASYKDKRNNKAKFNRR